MTKTVKIVFHGVLGDMLPKKEWNLAVKSVGEAIHAVEMLSKRVLYKSIHELTQKNIAYVLSINNLPFKTDQDLSKVETSELVLKRGNLESIDIVPVIEGAGDSALSIFTTILGVALIATGLGAFAGAGIVLGPTWGTVAVFAGLGLLAAGVTNLLTSPPKFEDFREIGGGGARSYLFNGPQNTVREGGPVPVGYGRLLVGSQVISSTYDIENIAATGVAIPTANSGVEPDHARWSPSNQGSRPN